MNGEAAAISRSSYIKHVLRTQHHGDSSAFVVPTPTSIAPSAHTHPSAMRLAYYQQAANPATSSVNECPTRSGYLSQPSLVCVSTTGGAVSMSTFTCSQQQPSHQYRTHQQTHAHPSLGHTPHHTVLASYQQPTARTPCIVSIPSVHAVSSTTVVMNVSSRYGTHHNQSFGQPLRLTSHPFTAVPYSQTPSNLSSSHQLPLNRLASERISPSAHSRPSPPASSHALATASLIDLRRGSGTHTAGSAELVSAASLPVLPRSISLTLGGRSSGSALVSLVPPRDHRLQHLSRSQAARSGTQQSQPADFTVHSLSRPVVELYPTRTFKHTSPVTSSTAAGSFSHDEQPPHRSTLSHAYNLSTGAVNMCRTTSPSNYSTVSGACVDLRRVRRTIVSPLPAITAAHNSSQFSSNSSSSHTHQHSLLSGANPAYKSLFVPPASLAASSTIPSLSACVVTSAPALQLSHFTTPQNLHTPHVRHQHTLSAVASTTAATPAIHRLSIQPAHENGDISVSSKIYYQPHLHHPHHPHHPHPQHTALAGSGQSQYHSALIADSLPASTGVTCTSLGHDTRPNYVAFPVDISASRSTSGLALTTTRSTPNHSLHHSLHAAAPSNYLQQHSSYQQQNKQPHSSYHQQHHYLPAPKVRQLDSPLPSALTLSTPSHTATSFSSASSHFVLARDLYHHQQSVAQHQSTPALNTAAASIPPQQQQRPSSAAPRATPLQHSPHSAANVYPQQPSAISATDLSARHSAGSFAALHSTISSSRSDRPLTHTEHQDHGVCGGAAIAAAVPLPTNLSLSSRRHSVTQSARHSSAAPPVVCSVVSDNDVYPHISSDTHHTQLSSSHTVSKGCYNPQTEAISPTFPSDTMDDSPYRSTKDGLLQQISSIDREIMKTESNIAKMKRKQIQFEELCEKSSQEAKALEHTPAPRRHLSQIVLEQNQAKLKSNEFSQKTSLFSVANISKSIATSTHQQPLQQPTYNQPSDVAAFTRGHSRFVDKFCVRFSGWLSKQSATEDCLRDTLRDRYAARLRLWLVEVERHETSTRQKQKCVKNREFYEKVFPEIRRAREERDRFNRVGRIIKSDAEMEELMDGLQEQENEARRMKSLTVVPPRLYTLAQRRYRFNNTNGLMADPMAVYRHSISQLTWTLSEQTNFKERFLQHPKQFHLVCSAVESKQLTECVCRYYMTKKLEHYKERLKKVRSRGGRSRGGGVGSGVSTLRASAMSAVTTSASLALPCLAALAPLPPSSVATITSAQQNTLQSAHGDGIVTRGSAAAATRNSDSSATSKVTPTTAALAADTACVHTVISSSSSSVTSSSSISSSSSDSNDEHRSSTATQEDSGLVDNSCTSSPSSDVSAAVSRDKRTVDDGVGSSSGSSADEGDLEEDDGRMYSVCCLTAGQAPSSCVTATAPTSDSNSSTGTAAVHHPHQCVVCLTQLDSYSQSRPLLPAQASSYGLCESSVDDMSRVCAACRCRSVQRKYSNVKCPVPTCPTPKFRAKKRLRTLPPKWYQISDAIRQLIMQELEISPEVTRCCSACHNRMCRRINEYEQQNGAITNRNNSSHAQSNISDVTTISDTSCDVSSNSTVTSQSGANHASDTVTSVAATGQDSALAQVTAADCVEESQRRGHPQQQQLGVAALSPGHDHQEQVSDSVHEEHSASATQRRDSGQFAHSPGQPRREMSPIYRPHEAERVAASVSASLTSAECHTAGGTQHATTAASSTTRSSDRVDTTEWINLSQAHSQQAMCTSDVTQSVTVLAAAVTAVAHTASQVSHGVCATIAPAVSPHSSSSGAGEHKVYITDITLAASTISANSGTTDCSTVHVTVTAPLPHTSTCPASVCSVAQEATHSYVAGGASHRSPQRRLSHPSFASMHRTMADLIDHAVISSFSSSEQPSASQSGTPPASLTPHQSTTTDLSGLNISTLLRTSATPAPSAGSDYTAPVAASSAQFHSCVQEQAQDLTVRRPPPAHRLQVSRAPIVTAPLPTSHHHGYQQSYVRQPGLYRGSIVHGTPPSLFPARPHQLQSPLPLTPLAYTIESASPPATMYTLGGGGGGTMESMTQRHHVLLNDYLTSQQMSHWSSMHVPSGAAAGPGGGGVGGAQTLARAVPVLKQHPTPHGAQHTVHANAVQQQQQQNSGVDNLSTLVDVALMERDRQQLQQQQQNSLLETMAAARATHLVPGASAVTTVAQAARWQPSHKYLKLVDSSPHGIRCPSGVMVRAPPATTSAIYATVVTRPEHHFVATTATPSIGAYLMQRRHTTTISNHSSQSPAPPLCTHQSRHAVTVCGGTLAHRPPSRDCSPGVVTHHAQQQLLTAPSRDNYISTQRSLDHGTSSGAVLSSVSAVGAARLLGASRAHSSPDTVRFPQRGVEAGYHSPRLSLVHRDVSPFQPSPGASSAMYSGQRRRVEVLPVEPPGDATTAGCVSRAASPQQDVPLNFTKRPRLAPSTGCGDGSRFSPPGGTTSDTAASGGGCEKPVISLATHSISSSIASSHTGAATCWHGVTHRPHATLSKRPLSPATTPSSSSLMTHTTPSAHLSHAQTCVTHSVHSHTSQPSHHPSSSSVSTSHHHHVSSSTCAE